MMDNDGLLASYIAHKEHLEDLEKYKNITYDSNETSSSAPKIYPRGVYPRLAPLHVTNNANYTYGMPLETSFGQNLQFQPLRPNMPHQLDLCMVKV
jgi:hypothetical protein